MNKIKHPFGEPSCEMEIKRLGDKYEDYYFFYAPFNTRVLNPDTYIIIGRRGSGKTSLANYFSFQKQYPNSNNILIESQEIFGDLFNNNGIEIIGMDFEIIIPKLIPLWKYFIWGKIFHHFSTYSKEVKFANDYLSKTLTVSNVIKSVFHKILNNFIDNEDNLYSQIDYVLINETIEKGKHILIPYFKSHPLFICIDTLEHYNLRNPFISTAVAALFEFASDFNLDYTENNINLKVFIPGEIFPDLIENIIRNPGKHIRDEIYLHWRPKDLMRLISWRYYKYLIDDGYIYEKNDIKWEKYTNVKNNFWENYFGKQFTNEREIIEDVFPYVLRHTQMKPREVITICNRIASLAKEEGCFPKFSINNITKGIEEICQDLASQIINSYNKNFPEVSKIIDALVGSPMIFRGNHLDKISSFTASCWRDGTYSQISFRNLVAELGIVGRVRNKEINGHERIEADFEYFMKDRLFIQPNDYCVVHPMFHKKLNIKRDKKIIVFPFPVHFEEIF